jgi:hypothetical protein
MAQPTATIRVTRQTRDELARQARARGTWLSSFLADIAAERRRSNALESELAAQLVDQSNPDVAEELADWDETLEDGLG